MSEQKTQHYYPHACKYEVPIVLKVPIYLDLEVVGSKPDCRFNNGYKSVSEAEEPQPQLEQAS
jgi:hypothetical protein